MAFIKLTTTRTVQPASIKGSFIISKKGKGMFFVSIPSKMAGKVWDAFDYCDISVGEGEDAGLIQVAPHAAGSFKIGHMKSALVLRVPRQAPWLCGAFDAVELEPVSKTDSEFVLRLPKQLFEVATYAQAGKQLPAVQQALPRDGERPRISIIGTTVEHGAKRVKLSMPQFKLFSALWKAWGEPVRATALQVAMGDDDRDMIKLLVTLNRDIEPLRLTVEAVQGGYKLLLVA